MKKSYKYGIEIECLVSAPVINEFVAELSFISGIDYGNDGSIQRVDPDDRPLEIRTMGGHSRTDITRIIHKLTPLFEKYEVKVNKSCGFHLHVSNKRFFNRLYLKKLTAFWVSIEDVLLATQPESRTNNRFCQRKLKEFATKKQLSLPSGKDRLVNVLEDQDRYYTLNLSSLAKHGTIEIRLHAGTLNAKKMLHFITLMHSVFEYVRNDYNLPEVKELFNMTITDEKIERVWSVLKLEKKVSRFYDLRISKFLYPALVRQQEAASKLLEARPKLESLNTSINKLVREQTELRDSLQGATLEFGSN